MKISFALAVFVGLISSKRIHQDTLPAWGLRSVNDHRDDAAVQASYGQHSITQANARPPYRSHVAVESDSESSDSDSED